MHMTEIELKFCIDDEAADRWRRHLSRPGASGERFRARYFDTPDLRLGRARMALRLRQEGTQWVQTLKGVGDGALRRLEHEVPLPLDPDVHAAPGDERAPVLDLARHASTPLAGLLERALGSAGGQDLVLRYETDVRRWRDTWVVEGGTRVEVALDLGEVRAAGRRDRIAELEIEHLDGPLSGLFAVATSALRQSGLWFSTLTKAERGERLLGVSRSLGSPARPDGASVASDLRSAVFALLPLFSAACEGSADAEALSALKASLQALCEGVDGTAHAGAALDPASRQALREAVRALAEGVAPGGAPLVACLRSTSLQLAVLRLLAMAEGVSAAGPWAG